MSKIKANTNYIEERKKIMEDVQIIINKYSDNEEEGETIIKLLKEVVMEW